MMEKIKRNSIINSGQTEIILHNYSNIEDDKFVSTIEANVSNSKERGNDNQLLLLDITNAYISTKVLDTFKKASIDIKPFTKKIAVIGVKGIQKVFFNIVLTFSKSNDLKSFKTKEEAINWLILP